MAKRARKQTEAERAAVDSERELAREHSGYDMPTGAFDLNESIGSAQGISSGGEREESTQEAIVGPNVTVGEFIDTTIEEAEEREPTEEDHEIAREIYQEMNAPLDAEVEEESAEEEPKESISVVRDKFKVKYIENARALGVPGKAAKRSNWDWLSQQLATFCLNDKHSIDIGAFTDVLDANGVDHSRWTNRNRGWEGRFRMTGRVALQKVVANAGEIKWPNGEPTAAPAEFIEKYKTKA
jgi:hypothetical protein